MKKLEKDKIKIDLDASLDIFGAGKVAESAEAALETIVKSNNFSKINTKYFLFLLLMVIGLIAIVVVSYLKIDAFSNFRFDIILYIWFGLIALYSLSLFLIGIFDKKKV